MPVIALVIACLGPACIYTATPEPFDNARQCMTVAPMIAGIARSQMTAALWTPSDTRRTTAFQCVDPRTGEVLAAFDSEDVAATRPLSSPAAGR